MPRFPMYRHVVRITWIFLFSLAIFGCAGPDSGTDTDKPSTPRAASAPAPADTTTAPKLVEREFPLLNNDNIEEFLMEYFKANPERRILVSTPLGDMKVRLYDDTPLHTANFLMLVKREYFNGTEFTRIIDDFIVQGGNNESETEEIKRILIGSYLIPAEFRPQNIHKKGVLSMARRYEDNPEKRSAAYNFFFVDGRTFNEPQLLMLERDHDMSIPEWKREVYKTVGGAPHLDGQHTVFGEIYEGLDVLEKLSAVETDEFDWPLSPLPVEMSVIE